MRISTTSNATPQSTPPSSADSQGGSDASARDEQFIWRSLVPRLVHPARLQIVEALIDKDGPMTVEELTPLVPHVAGNTDLVRYHAKAMTKAGALEVAGENEEPSFFFALPK
jgi:Helix-turn-helix domain